MRLQFFFNRFVRDFKIFSISMTCSCSCWSSQSQLLLKNAIVRQHIEDFYNSHLFCAHIWLFSALPLLCRMSRNQCGIKYMYCWQNYFTIFYGVFIICTYAHKLIMEITILLKYLWHLYAMMEWKIKIEKKKKEIIIIKWGNAMDGSELT